MLTFIIVLAVVWFAVAGLFVFALALAARKSVPEIDTSATVPVVQVQPKPRSVPIWFATGKEAV